MVRKYYSFKKKRKTWFWKVVNRPYRQACKGPLIRIIRMQLQPVQIDFQLGSTFFLTHNFGFSPQGFNY